MGKAKVTWHTIPLFDAGRLVRYRHRFVSHASLLYHQELLERFKRPKARKCQTPVDKIRRGKQVRVPCGRNTLRDEFGRPKEWCREHEQDPAIKALAAMKPLKL